LLGSPAPDPAGVSVGWPLCVAEPVGLGVTGSDGRAVGPEERCGDGATVGPGERCGDGATVGSGAIEPVGAGVGPGVSVAGPDLPGAWGDRLAAGASDDGSGAWPLESGVVSSVDGHAGLDVDEVVAG
jgi:hypothetical protein